MDKIYLIIVDNEVVATSNSHQSAQELGRAYSLRQEVEVAKVIFLPTLRLNGTWVRGERHA